jgi:hypothetical protein
MSQLINRLNKTVSENNETLNEINQENLENEVIGSDEKGEEFTENEYSESDKEDIGENIEENVEENKVKDTELLSEENENENVIYTIKINGDTKCYCSTSEEVNEMIEYIICKLKYKLNLQGWNNVQCITRDNKILWKVLDSNRIVAQLTGNRPNSLIFYENILAEIEVEIVKGYKENKETLIL